MTADPDDESTMTVDDGTDAPSAPTHEQAEPGDTIDLNDPRR